MGKFTGHIITIALLLIFSGYSCKNEKSTEYDSPTKGTINISVDETFKPVIEEQIKVYQSSYPDAHIIAAYKSEADCLRDLQKDSTRMIIVAKGLTDEEGALFKQRLSYKPNWGIIAYDAVSVIINANSKDSVYTMARLKNLLTDSSVKKDVIVDGNNATSTVRYLLDSVLKGAKFSNNVRAVDGSKAVLDYVAENANAVGFVGSSWVGNEEDPEQVKYFNKIHFALIECKSCGSNIFAKPSQSTLSNGQYPLVRPLYYVLKENSTGLGTGFVNFLSLERGQLIFRRANLVPAKMQFNVRKVSEE